MSAHPLFSGRPHPLVIYLSVGGIGLLILAVVSYGFYIGDRMTSLDAPMVNAVSKIKLEAAIAGLMIEEILTNGIVGGLEENWEPLDTAVSTVSATGGGAGGLENGAASFSKRRPSERYRRIGNEASGMEGRREPSRSRRGT